jgi:cytochrome c-type biogenesis protein CcmH/NrfG
MTAASALADDSAPSLLAQGRVDEAITTLRGQINSSPNDPEAHNLLCRAYFSLGEWDRGISNCERAVSLEPTNSRYHLWLGRVYGEKADKANFITASGLAKKVHMEFERRSTRRSGRVLY